MASRRATKEQVRSSPRALAGCGFALALLCLPSRPALAQPVPGAPRPNIVIILADDLGYGDLRSYNADSRIPTLHLDLFVVIGAAKMEIAGKLPLPLRSGSPLFFSQSQAYNPAQNGRPL